MLMRKEAVLCRIIEPDSRSAGRPEEPSIKRPEWAGRQQRRGQKVTINPADAQTPEFPGFDQLHRFVVGCGTGGGQRLEIAQNAGAIAKVPAGQFTHDERMDDGQAVAQQLGKVLRALTKVGNPNRGVYQNHSCP